MKTFNLVLSLGIVLGIVGCDQFRGQPGAPGQNGQDGLTSLVSVQKMAVDQNVCSSEEGTVVSSGLDSNRNGVLDSSEITMSQVVCDGLNGTNGVDGRNGTVVAPTQFCPPSFQPQYPGEFPEYGLCIDGVMYGVYSANGGFLTLLEPGAYNSNGINASCTFVLDTGCHVE